MDTTKNLPMTSSSIWSKCPNCKSLKSEILRHMEAYKLVAKLSPSLSPAIVLENIEDMIKRDDWEIQDVGSDDPGIVEKIDQLQNDVNLNGQVNAQLNAIEPSDMEIMTISKPQVPIPETISKENDPQRSSEILEETPDFKKIPENNKIVERVTRQSQKKKVNSVTSPIQSTRSEDIEESQNNLSDEKLSMADEFIQIISSKKKDKRKKSYQCLICQSKTRNRRNLQKHVSRVHSKNPTQCNQVENSKSHVENGGQVQDTRHRIAKVEPIRTRSKKKDIRQHEGGPPLDLKLVRTRPRVQVQVKLKRLKLPPKIVNKKLNETPTLTPCLVSQSGLKSLKIVKKTISIPGRASLKKVYSKILKVPMKNGEYEYTCLLCDKKFPWLNTTSKHIRKVHWKEDRQQCPHCPIDFVDQSCLKVHQQRFHGSLKK